MCSRKGPYETYNKGLMAVASIPFGGRAPHVRLMGVRCACGEPNDMKESAHTYLIEPVSPPPTHPPTHRRSLPVQEFQDIYGLMT